MHLFIYHVADKFERTVLPRPFIFFFGTWSTCFASFCFVLFLLLSFRCQGFDAATGRCTVKVKSWQSKHLWIVPVCVCDVCAAAAFERLLLSERLWLCSNMFMLLVIFLWIGFCVRCQIAWVLSLTVVSKLISFASNGFTSGQSASVCLHECELFFAFWMYGWGSDEWESNNVCSFFLVSHYHEQHFTFGFGFGAFHVQVHFVSLSSNHIPHVNTPRHIFVFIVIWMFPYSNVWAHIELCVRETQTAYAIY